MSSQAMTEYVPQPPLTVDEVKAQIQRIQEIHRNVMKKDVHYGVISGTTKPTLYKAGSELLLTTFHIAVDPDIEDLSGDDEIRYRIRLRGVANAEIKLGVISGHVVGTGVGECSSNEEKYKWRFAMPKEFAATPADRRRTKYGWKWGQVQGEKVETETPQVRTNPADLANTVLKMAKKRAQADLCLTGLAASDVFDQDLDDMPEGITDGNQPTAHPKAQTETPTSTATQQDPTKICTEKQAIMVGARLDDSGIPQRDFLDKFGISSVVALPFVRVDEALNWIKEMTPGPQ